MPIEQNFDGNLSSSNYSTKVSAGLTFPISLPVLPLISSKLSGFFF